MITTSVAWDFVLWALFWLVVAWALWWGIQDIRKWLKQDGNGRADLRDFPDEAMGEVRPPKPTANGSPRREPGGGRRV